MKLGCLIKYIENFSTDIGNREWWSNLSRDRNSIFNIVIILSQNLSKESIAVWLFSQILISILPTSRLHSYYYSKLE